MVYRVLMPWWTLGLPEMDTFVWTQAQWVGVPLDEVGNGRRAVPDYREGETQDAVDVTVDSQGSLFVAARTATSNAQKRTEARAGTSEPSKATGRDAKRRPQRAVEALRKEAQRRLQQARRAGKTKQGGRTAALPKGKTRTLVKKSDPLNGPSATLVIQWTPDVILGSKACAIDGGAVADGFYVELHLLTDGSLTVWHEWTEMQENAVHGGQQVRQEHWTQSTGDSPCAPLPAPGQILTSFAGWMPSVNCHNGSWMITAKYGWQEPPPPGGSPPPPQFGQVSMTVNFSNLLIEPDPTNPIVLVCDPDDPAKRQTRVKMNLSDATRSNGEVLFTVYLLNDPAPDREAIKTIDLMVTMPTYLEIYFTRSHLDVLKY